MSRTARNRGWFRPTPLSAVGALLVAGTVLAGCGAAPSGSGTATGSYTLAPAAGNSTQQSGDSGNGSQPGTAGQSASHGKTYVEHADNHAGSPVFAGTDGAAVPDGVASRIPYGTAVNVVCFAPNGSGMTSVNGFYKIADGPWQGLYVVANTMDNNAGMGPNGVDRDSRVPAC